MRQCLIALLAVAFVSGGIGRCLATPAPKAAARVIVDHSAHAVAGHSTHGGHHTLPVHDHGSDSSIPAHDGCTPDKASCCVGCLVLGAAAEGSATELLMLRLMFSFRDDVFSHNVVLIDPGIPKQAV